MLIFYLSPENKGFSSKIGVSELTLPEIYQECIYAPTDFDKLIQEPEEKMGKTDEPVDGGASEVM